MTFSGYLRESGGLVDVELFRAMAVDGENLFVYDKNSLQRSTALGAWKRRWAVLRKWCAGIIIDARFADMLFIRCEQEILNCHTLWGAFDAKMEAKDGDPQLRRWFFQKWYASHYSMHGGSHRTRTMAFEAHHCMAVCSFSFVGWRHLERCAV